MPPETEAVTGKKAKTPSMPPPAAIPVVEEPEKDEEVDELDKDEKDAARADAAAEGDAPRESLQNKTPKAEALKAVTKPTKQDEAIENLHRRENETVTDWLSSLQGKGPIQIRLHRLAPKVFAGKNTKGHIETIDDIITEDEIRDQYGGGQYQLRVMHRNKSGTWVFMTSTTVDIAGDPRIDNLPKAEPNAEANGSQAQTAANASNDRIVSVLERELERNRQPQHRGPELEQLQLMMKPLEVQIKALTDSLAKKDEQLQALANKPQNPFQEKLLDKMIDQDSARVEAVRTQFMSEIRVIKEGALADEKRLKDSFERERDALKRDHERELDRMKASFEREIASMKSMQEQLNSATNTSSSVTKTQLEGDIRRLERDLAAAQIDVKELRAKKDLGPVEMALQLDKLKEALGVDDDGGDKDKGTLERLTDTVLQSDKLFDFAGKWFGKGAAPAQQQPQQQQAMQAQPRVIRDRKTGQVFVKNDAGQYVPVRRRRAPDGTETNDMEEGVQIPPEQVEFATKVLEGAFMNGTKPENVAATISTNLSPEIFQAIRDHGVDGFLNKVAKLGGASPLRRQDGINWLRKLGKALLGESTSEQEESAPEPPVDDEEFPEDLE